MRKRFISLSIVILLLFGASITAYAQEMPDLTQKGSIEVTMQTEDEVVPGGTLTLYRVGEIQEKNGGYSFGLAEDFADSQQSLEDIHSPELAEGLAEYAVQEQGVTLQIDENGNVMFEELELGLYLMVQYDAAIGYEQVSPFLVSVPIFLNGSYIYQVDASPKVGLLSAGPLPPTEPPADTPTPPPTNPPGNTPTPPPATPTPVPTPTPSVPTLPQTGQLNWPIPLLAVLGFGVFVVGWMLRFSQKKDNDEK